MQQRAVVEEKKGSLPSASNSSAEVSVTVDSRTAIALISVTTGILPELAGLALRYLQHLDANQLASMVATFFRGHQYDALTRECCSLFSPSNPSPVRALALSGLAPEEKKSLFEAWAATAPDLRAYYLPCGQFVSELTESSRASSSSVSPSASVAPSTVLMSVSGSSSPVSRDLSSSPSSSTSSSSSADKSELKVSVVHTTSLLQTDVARKRSLLMGLAASLFRIARPRDWESPDAPYVDFSNLCLEGLVLPNGISFYKVSFAHSNLSRGRIECNLCCVNMNGVLADMTDMARVTFNSLPCMLEDSDPQSVTMRGAQVTRAMVPVVLLPVLVRDQVSLRSVCVLNGYQAYQACQESSAVMGAIKASVAGMLQAQAQNPLPPFPQLRGYFASRPTSYLQCVLQRKSMATNERFVAAWLLCQAQNLQDFLAIKKRIAGCIGNESFAKAIAEIESEFKRLAVAPKPKLELKA